MKKTLTTIAIALTVPVLLSACGSTEKAKDPAPVTTATNTPPPATSTAPATSTPTTTAPIGRISPLDDPKSVLAGRSVYFDYDSNAVKAEGQSLVQAHAKFMTENPGARISLEGNTDERGSREYNLALGQRRADAVKQIMTVVGVAAARIETVSFGEEKPKSPGHDEAAWAQNRRADIVYKSR